MARRALLRRDGHVYAALRRRLSLHPRGVRRPSRVPALLRGGDHRAAYRRRSRLNHVRQVPAIPRLHRVRHARRPPGPRRATHHLYDSPSDSDALHL